MADVTYTLHQLRDLLRYALLCCYDTITYCLPANNAACCKLILC